MIDTETTTRIHDPSDPNNGTVSVRVCFAAEIGPFDFGEIRVYGIFRQSDDSEIDEKSLDQSDRDAVLTACEKEFASRYENNKPPR